MPRAATVIMCEWWRWMPRIKNKHESHFPVCWHSTISHHRQRNLTIGRLKIIYPTAKCVGSFVVYAPVIFVAWAFFPIYVAAVDAARQSSMDFICRLVASAHLHSFHLRCHKYLCDAQNWHSTTDCFCNTKMFPCFSSGIHLPQVNKNAWRRAAHCVCFCVLWQCYCRHHAGGISDMSLLAFGFDFFFSVLFASLLLWSVLLFCRWEFPQFRVSKPHYDTKNKHTHNTHIYNK